MKEENKEELIQPAALDFLTGGSAGNIGEHLRPYQRGEIILEASRAAFDAYNEAQWLKKNKC